MSHVRVQLDVTDPDGEVTTYVFHKVRTHDDGWCGLRVEPREYPDITATTLERVSPPTDSDLILNLRGRLLPIDDNGETHRVIKPNQAVGSS